MCPPEYLREVVIPIPVSQGQEAESTWYAVFIGDAVFGPVGIE
jgi:hypothetical protein